MLKVIRWNVKRARDRSNEVWDLFNAIDPDIAVLQELVSVPPSITRQVQILSKHARAKDGNDQRFFTAILVKGSIDAEIGLTSEWGWVNEELSKFAGNLIAAKVTPVVGPPVNVISVYSPAWPIMPRERFNEFDVEQVKLRQNPDLWLTEILWAALRTSLVADLPWIIAGDLNSSVTFDTLWQGGPRGNQEIQDRMKDLGLTECLSHFQGKLTPTFQNAANKKIIHQIDHLFVTQGLYRTLERCYTADPELIFGKGISDHLPIIAEFNIGEQ